MSAREGPVRNEAIAGVSYVRLDAAVVQHVQILEASGLIRTHKTGRTRICKFEPGALRLVDGWIAERRAEWERRLDQLGVYLTESDPREARHEGKDNA